MEKGARGSAFKIMKAPSPSLLKTKSKSFEGAAWNLWAFNKHLKKILLYYFTKFPIHPKIPKLSFPPTTVHPKLWLFVSASIFGSRNNKINNNAREKKGPTGSAHKRSPRI